MDITNVLAEILGMIFVVLGLSMVFNKKFITIVVEGIAKNESVIWLAGLCALIMGSVVVTLNNTWTSGLPLLVTILGWLMLIKGTVILIFPSLTASYYKKINSGNVFVWGGLIVFILGLVLILQ